MDPVWRPVGDGPEVLLLDVMGTLVYDPFRVEMPRFLGMSLEELLAAKDPTAWAEFEAARIDEPQLFARFFADGRPFDGPGLKAHAARHYRLLDGIEPLLQALMESGVPMHALSNYPHWYRQVELATGLSRYLQWSFVSWDTGLRKPHPEAYLHAARSLGIAPRRLLFVDDSDKNVGAARTVGMDAVCFVDSVQLARDLAARGLPVG